jgi:ubiquinone/menaquinone biosynthesis C-methylase UbiE
MEINQKQHWNSLHKAGDIAQYSQKQTDFAEEVNKLIPADSSVLDLGCGSGNDSVYFAKHNHTVLGTDFSDIAIEKNKLHYQNLPKLQFIVQDLSDAFPFKDSSFSVMYARLSLHYFSDKVTKQIFNEIYRVLKIQGLLCFICKSVHDPLYGKGERIEKDMFTFNNHVRHFFSKEYVQECLAGKFEIKLLETGEDSFYNKNSAFVKVIAQKVFS